LACKNGPVVPCCSDGEKTNLLAADEILARVATVNSRRAAQRRGSWVQRRGARKKAKVTKSSSRDGSGKVANAANPQTSDVAVILAPPPKLSSAQTTSVKPPISIKAPAMYSLMDMITNPKGGGQVSSTAKVSKASKDAPSKSSAGSVKNIPLLPQPMLANLAKIQDKNLAIAALCLMPLNRRLRSRTRPKIRVSKPLSRPRPRFRTRMWAKLLRQLPYEPQVQPRNILSPSAGGELFLHSIFETMQEEFLPFDVTFDSVEVAKGSSLACDESLAITHASLRQYRELSWVKADRDTLRKDLSVLETKVKEKEEALALSEKRLADLSSEKETLSKSAEDFKTKVASLDKQVEELDASLVKVREVNEDLRGKVDAADQELAALAKTERLRLSGACGRVRDALIYVGTIEHCQTWLTTNIPYVVKACRTFSNNIVHLAVRDLLYSLEAGGSDALAKAVCDSFSFISTNTTPPSLIEALVKFADHIDDSFWSRVLAIGRQPQSEDSSDFFLSEFATPKASSDVLQSKFATPESSSDVSLSEFATPEPSSDRLARREPPIEIFSSSSEIHLSSDSDPLSPVEGCVDSFTFPPDSLVAIGRVYNSGSDASEGRRGRGRRGSRGRPSRSGPSSSRGSARKKRGGQGRHSLPVDSEGPSSSFDAVSQVERMVSFGGVDPVFQRPYLPSSGYDF
ncbi:hypothetical protein EJB05_22624, partial [Eragrostis curvula]